MNTTAIITHLPIGTYYTSSTSESDLKQIDESLFTLDSTGSRVNNVPLSEITRTRALKNKHIPKIIALSLKYAQ